MSSAQPKKRRASKSKSTPKALKSLGAYDPGVQFGDKEIATAYFSNTEG